MRLRLKLCSEDTTSERLVRHGFIARLSKVFRETGTPRVVSFSIVFGSASAAAKARHLRRCCSWLLSAQQRLQAPSALRPFRHATSARRDVAQPG